MKYRSRLVEPLLLDLVRHFPVVAVLGARQVGKSTLVAHAVGDEFKTITFDPVIDVGQARTEPELFLRNNPGRLFLDEIQYAPELLPVLKREVDRDRHPGRFILSGSQDLAVVKGISESLAGRVALVDLFPMTVSECAERPSHLLHDWVSGEYRIPDTQPIPLAQWHRRIWRGGLPALLDVPDHLVARYFDAYVRTYVERDIRSVAAIGDLQRFGAFCALVAGLSSCEVNASQMGRDLGIDRRTAKSWLSVLRATYQWVEIPAYTRNAVKAVAGKTKGFVTDTGLMCWQQRVMAPDAVAGHPLQGRIVETWAVMEILRRVQSWATRPALWHYRSARGAKVALVLEYAGRLHPIEIKSTGRPRRRDCSGTASFRGAFPTADIAPGLVVCAIPEPEWIAEDVLAVPWWMV